jgi:HK97 gp10 family phage protein
MVMIEVNIQRDGARIGLKVRDMSLDMLRSIDKSLFVASQLLRNRIVRSMTNTPRANWQYRRGSVTHRPSAPGYPPARDTGELVRAIIADAGHGKMEVGAEAGATYAKFLETGTSTMKARPWLVPAWYHEKDNVHREVMTGIMEAIRRNGGGTL